MRRVVRRPAVLAFTFCAIGAAAAIAVAGGSAGSAIDSAKGLSKAPPSPAAVLENDLGGFPCFPAPVRQEGPVEFRIPPGRFHRNLSGFSHRGKEQGSTSVKGHFKAEIIPV